VDFISGNTGIIWDGIKKVLASFDNTVILHQSKNLNINLRVLKRKEQKP